jgi:16S rRNA G966 N2-methylase RsmD
MKYGKHYIFIFKQNLRTTNIQYKELLALLQRFSYYSDKNKNELIFLSSKEFVNKIGSLIKCFINDSELLKARKAGSLDSIKSKLTLLDETYKDIFEKTVVVEPYYTSCAVYLPYNIEIKLEQICFYSGYIHSCGTTVFIRNITKANRNDFIYRLRIFKKYYKEQPEESKINLMIYTHEDFSPYDRIEASNDFLKNGLDNIKFYVEKFYMQKMPLFDVLESIKEEAELKDFIDVMPAGNYRDKKGAPKSSCLWLIVDSNIGENLQYPGDRKYYICYHQQYINENPFHIFDENKPGWIDHVTIPHTLTGAMLNIGLSAFASQKTVKAIDPFAGSGTTYLESLKHENIVFSGSDLCPLSNIVTNDNLQFFSMDITKLESINEFIGHVLEEIKGNGGKNSHFVRIANLVVLRYEEVYKFVSDKSFSANSEKIFVEWVETFTNKIISFEKNGTNVEADLEDGSMVFMVRLLTYTMIKAVKRNYYAKLRERTEWKEAFRDELNDLHFRINTFYKIRKKMSVPNTQKDNIMIIYNGSYSLACSLNDKYLSAKHKENNNIVIESNIDILKKLEKITEQNERYDLIIMDPPYGFNTEEEIRKFSDLYKKMFNLLIKNLNVTGVMLLCLPAQSHSGREVNYFTQKEIVMDQINAAATLNKMSIQQIMENSVPRNSVFVSPLYWDSEKALKRDIICIQFIKRQ